jgi:hypothetical protein
LTGAAIPRIKHNTQWVRAPDRAAQALFAQDRSILRPDMQPTAHCDDLTGVMSKFAFSNVKRARAAGPPPWRDGVSR